MNFDRILTTSSVEADIAIWNVSNFHPLPCKMRSTSSELHGTCQIGENYLAICQKNSTKIKIWSWSQTNCIENYLPEKCLSLVATHEGNFLFAGGKSGKIYLWELSSGSLLHCWQAHYKAVTLLKMDLSGTTLISSSEDAMIHVWLLPDILDPPAHKALTPFKSWSGHTLPVTDIEVLSSLNELLVISVSLDCTCQFWSLMHDNNIKALNLPYPLLSIAVDKAQCSVFCGCQNGSIYTASLVALSSDGLQHKAFEHSHSQAVTSLATSYIPERLVSGSLDGTVKVWDLLSSQCLTTLEYPGKRPIAEIIIVNKSVTDRQVDDNTTPIIKLTEINKFPRPSHAEDLLYENTPVVLNAQTVYKGISHQVLKKPSIQTRSLPGIAREEHPKVKELKLDSSMDTANDSKQLDPNTLTLTSLIERILEEDNDI